jgi:cell division protease FtsH
VNYREQTGPNFLGGPNGSDREHSEQTAREIDLEVRKIIDDATEEVRAILAARRDALEAVAQQLIEKEVMDGAELRQLLEQRMPGPKLVPGTLAVDEPSSPTDPEQSSGPMGVVGMP